MNAIRWVALAATLLGVLLTNEAQAYSWMNRHGYAGCGTCHTDPSGGSLLTQYGRAQSSLLLSTRYGTRTEAEEPARASAQLFGLAELPTQVLVGGWLRGGRIWNVVDGSLVDQRLLFMRADVGAHVTLGRFSGAATLGYAPASSAAQTEWVQVTHNEGGNAVSREHWLGLRPGEGFLLRVGRLNVPFGLRNAEHTAWVRAETRTDLNQHQQHGAALAVESGAFRSEAMLILGNYQIGPDLYRERGGAGYVEWTFLPRQSLGLSLLMTHAGASPSTGQETLRQILGVFSRNAVGERLAILAEADVLAVTTPRDPVRLGTVAFLQADYEPLRGLHAIVTTEHRRRADAESELEWAAWGGVAWFFLPHFDVRADAVRRWEGADPSSMTYLVQLHGYL
jgi:hypothetical protein